ncbi:S-layer homology domain-containing protein [Paenibacillus harenae]|uniref:S-layer homology domain-containing protein n=1 Tax=Paenibacillus harenae TaxID=306543 RepID=UPI0004125BE7|nr:S-layer homology domain-containing protein [Paenibacillus harenae]
MRHYRIGLLMLAAIMLFYTIPPLHSHAAAQQDFVLSMDKRTVGHQGKIIVTASGKVTDLYGFEAAFTYDSTRLRLISEESEAMFSGFSVPPIVEGNHIIVAHTKIGEKPLENGQTALYQLVFEAIGHTGDAVVEWTSLKSVDGGLRTTEQSPNVSATVKVTPANDPQLGLGSVTIPPPALVNGNRAVPHIVLDGRAAIASVAQDILEQLFSASAPSASGKRKAIIEMTAQEGANEYELSIPADFFKGRSGARSLEVQSAIAAVTLPDTVFEANEMQDASQIELRIAAADTSRLSQSLKNKLKDKPVVDLELSIDGKPVHWNNHQAPITISMNYEPTAEELMRPEHIVIWYIDNEGEVIRIPSGRYNPDTGRVTFTVTHFSQYAVVFDIKSFRDLAGYAWAQWEIEVLASKGIIQGVSDSNYAPDQQLTRAELVTLLVRALGLHAETKADASFADVKSSDYYGEPVAIAKKLGIALGKGNNQFHPMQPVTRQEMMVLSMRAMEAAGIVLSAANDAELNRFQDQALISSYARDAVITLVSEGIIQGKGSAIQPQSTATRAEMAIVLYKIYNKLMEV